MRWGERLIGLVASPRVCGQVDERREGGLSGWAFSRADPSVRLVLRVEIERDVFQPLLADLYRADVQRAGLGHDGYCGFRLPRGRIRWNGRARVLAGSAGVLLPDPADRARRAPDSGTLRRGGLAFRLTATSGTQRVEGWLADLSVADTRRVLRLEADDGTVRTTRACLYRPTSDAALDDHHGFSIDVPQGAKAFRLVDAQSGTVLHEHVRKRSRLDALRARR